MPAEDHMQLKWFLSFLRAKFTIWGRIIFGMVLVGMAISSVGTQISAYFFVSLVWALFLTSLILSLFFKPTVITTCSMMPTPTAGGIYKFQVTVTNSGHGPIRNVEVLLHKLPYGLYAIPDHPDQKSTIDWLGPNEKAVLTVVLRIPRRGVFIMGPLIIGTSFPSGLIRSTVRFAGRVSLTVFPRLLKINDHALFQGHRLHAEGNEMNSSLGGSNEFLSTREYREGDRPRDVHWNSSARTGKLIVKEYIHEDAVHTGMFLDLELKRFDKHRCFEARIALCGGIAEDFYKRNYTVALFSSNTNAPLMKFGEGKNSFSHLLETLSGIEGIPTIDLLGPLAKIKEHSTDISILILFLHDWDPARAAFVNALKALGIPIKAFVVRDKPLSLIIADPLVSVYTSKQLGYT